MNEILQEKQQQQQSRSCWSMYQPLKVRLDQARRQRRRRRSLITRHPLQLPSRARTAIAAGRRRRREQLRKRRREERCTKKMVFKRERNALYLLQSLPCKAPRGRMELARHLLSFLLRIPPRQRPWYHQPHPQKALLRKEEKQAKTKTPRKETQRQTSRLQHQQRTRLLLLLTIRPKKLLLLPRS